MFGKIFLFFRKSQYLVLVKLMQSNRVVTAWLLLHTGSAFYSVFVVWAVFQLRWRKKTYLKRRPLFRSQIFKCCCDIQGSHLISYLWVSFIIDQSECLICYFLCTELTLFCTELTLLHWINSLLHWINSLVHWITWKPFILTNQNWVIFPCILLYSKDYS